MKILHLQTFPLWGSGSGTYVRKLAEKQVAEGHKVAIVCPDSRQLNKIKIFNVRLPFYVDFTGSHQEYKNTKKIRDLTCFQFTKMYQPWLRESVRAVKNFQPDIVHAHHISFTAWIASYLYNFHKIPYIITAHGTGVDHAQKDARFVGLTREALRSAKYIIANSPYTKHWFLKVFGRKELYKLRIIGGGVDLSKYPKNFKIKIIDKKYDLQDKKVVLFTGKLKEAKGVDYLIKAACKIKGEIYIIGDGPVKSDLERLARERKALNVHFLGYMGREQEKEFLEFYYRADVFVIPSVWHEPFGLVTLEAMAAGVPVVGSKKGGIPMALKDGENGYLVRARSARAIALAVNKILENRRLHKKMGRNARKTVETQFNWTQITKEYLHRYEACLQNGNSK